MPDCVEICNPADQLASYKCMACLSEAEMKAVIIIALAAYLEQTVEETIDCSKCWTCLSNKQLLQTAATVVGGTFLSRYTIPEIRDLIKCLLCTPDNHRLNAILAYQLCAFFNAET